MLRLHHPFVIANFVSSREVTIIIMLRLFQKASMLSINAALAISQVYGMCDSVESPKTYTTHRLHESTVASVNVSYYWCCFS